MSYTFLVLFLVLLSFILSIILVKIMVVIMPKFGIVDKPNSRRAHSKTTPRAGGLAFVIIVFFLLPIFEYYTKSEVYNSIKILQIFVPIALVSFWDDVLEVPILFRLLIHILCSLLAIMWIVHPYKILHNELPIIVDLLIGSFALLTFLNIYNFLDGIDGITVSESIHLSLTILIICFIKHDIIPNLWLIMTTASIILGWSAGFILFNWQPAKIFPGDVGSISIGFLLGICLLNIASSSEHLFLSCVIASLYYVADGGLTLLIRLVNGEKFWQPHLQHFFQKSVKNGRSHKQVVLGIIKCNFFLMLCAIGALFWPIISAILALCVVTITLVKSVR